MRNALRQIPDDPGLLCETCGYALSGLPDSGRCPECGADIASSSPNHRSLPDWERSMILPRKFVSTTMKVLLHPRRFYRTLITRRAGRPSYSFALTHWVIASLLFGASAAAHMRAFVYFDLPFLNKLFRNPLASTAILGLVTFLLFAMTTPLAARLTTWEARYRGLRLPLPVVRRGLDYHAADYLPVAFLTFLTIVGYRWLIDHHRLTSSSDAKYLGVVCGEVIVFAAYLFNAYWIAMRNMMYANA